jgi:adenosylmethionine-8-amino-7-oxononanoate aminotransferase
VSHVFPRHSKASYPIAVAGEGMYVTDSQGRRYLDACGGAAVSCLGHGHPAVVQAIKDQVDKIAYAHSAFFTTEVSEELADHLIQRAPQGLERVYFVSGGSEANETALKLARQFHLENGEAERSHFIARQQSYHGNTLGVLAVGGNAARRAPYQPMLIPASHIAPCYAYRHQGHDESEEAYGRRVADELEAEIQRVGPNKVAAFIAEPVVGATLGVVPAVAGYFKRIREICDRHGVLLILDEVMCGMGRTGSLYACEQEGITPDILTCAKGLGGGYQPIGAMLCSRRIYDTIAGGSGAFEHGFTYIGHATACAAALAVQKTIDSEGLLDNVQRQGDALRAALGERFGNHHHVGDIRGRGLFIGIELVADRNSKEPFDPALKVNARIKKRAMEEGMFCYPGGGSADGRRGDHILLAPPFIVEQEHVDEIVERLGRTVEGVLAEVAGPA